MKLAQSRKLRYAVKYSGPWFPSGGNVGFNDLKTS